VKPAEGSEDYISVDVDLQAVRAGSSDALLKQLYNECVNRLTQSLEKVWIDAENHN
jgi:hypothetical protein